MKLRIAIWAAIGALAVAIWSACFLISHPDQHGTLMTLVCLTCPIAFARNHAMSIYFVFLVNAATYAIVGALIESVWRYFKSHRPIAHGCRSAPLTLLNLLP